jgi:N-acetyl sugar amidotransferase
MKKCTKCSLPETYETLEFTESGTCNICVQHQFKTESIDWDSRKQRLDKIIEDNRGKYEYDCILPFSGGKDSTFTLYYLMKEYGLKPLVVQFNHGFMRPTLQKNNERTFKKLGVDVITFTPNWNVVKRVMLEALVRKGDFCWHCHTGIFSYPMHIALKYNTPLVLWGEPSSEYTAYYDYKDDEIEAVDETRFNRFVNLGITAEDMRGMVDPDSQEFDPRDFKPYTYPNLRDLKKLRYQSECLGSYIPWDAKAQSELIMDELGWQGDQVEGMPPGLYGYEKIECHMQGVRDYIKYLKRGYSRVTQMTVLDIRNGRMDKAEADSLVAEYEGKKPPSLIAFLEYVGITEFEFNNIVKKTVVAPFEPDFSKDEWSPKNWDFDLIYREKN